MFRRACLALVLVACGDSSPTTPAPGASASNDATTAPTPPAPTPTTDAATTTSVIACPTATAPTSAGTIASSEIDEASGIVVSKTNPSVYWVHNDSGDTARAFAISSTGKLLLTLKFDAATATDIEDMAIEETADGKSFLYFADIGDNDADRTSYVIHRVEEPKLAAGASDAKLTVQSEKMKVEYVDGSHNAETLLFDPTTKDLLIATKVSFGNSAIHRVGPFAAGTTATTTKIASVPIALANGGDITRDGRLFAIRNYGTSAFVWARAPGDDLATMFARTACKIPIATERQGEAFGFSPDGAGYVTVSEGAHPALNVARFE